MGIEIDSTIIEQATACEKSLSCLTGTFEGLCRVVRCVSGTVHFIECEEGLYCRYQVSFGEGFFCDCPVRKEIHNRYKR